MILDQRYGTGLEDQVAGVHHVGRNTPIRTVGATPTARCDWYRHPIGSWQQITPSREFRSALEEATGVQFKSDAKDRDY
jgi:hypothetical protein